MAGRERNGIPDLRWAKAKPRIQRKIVREMKARKGKKNKTMRVGLNLNSSIRTSPESDGRLEAHSKIGPLGPTVI